MDEQIPISLDDFKNKALAGGAIGRSTSTVVSHEDHAPGWRFEWRVILPADAAGLEGAALNDLLGAAFPRSRIRGPARALRVKDSEPPTADVAVDISQY